MVAGDNLFSDDLSGFGDLCRELDAPVLAVYDVGDLAQMSKYNSIETDERGRITFFEEKPEHAQSTLTGIALYFYPRRVLPLIAQYVAEGNNPDQPGRLVQWLYPRIGLLHLEGARHVVRHRLSRDAARSGRGLFTKLTRRRCALGGR